MSEADKELVLANLRESAKFWKRQQSRRDNMPDSESAQAAFSHADNWVRFLVHEADNMGCIDEAELREVTSLSASELQQFHA